MKKTLLLLTTIAAVFSACHKQTFDEQVLADVEKFNTQEAPKRIDDYTTFDSMVYDTKNLTLSYFYTIEGDIDPSIFPTDALREELFDNVRNSIHFKPYKEHGLNFHYIYFLQKTRKPVFDCIFTPEDYNPRSTH